MNSVKTDIIGGLLAIGGAVYGAVAAASDQPDETAVNTDEDQQDTLKQQEITNQVSIAKENFSTANVVGDISSVAQPLHVASGVF